MSGGSKPQVLLMRLKVSYKPTEGLLHSETHVTIHVHSNTADVLGTAHVGVRRGMCRGGRDVFPRRSVQRKSAMSSRLSSAMCGNDWTKKTMFHL